MYMIHSTNVEVSRASQTHQAPHVGLPQMAPLASAIAQYSAPVGASARAIIDDKRVRSTRPRPAYTAITR